ncbi:MAG: DUF3343 domain-containing protein [Ruminococcaceae bacterium]|nr:DUF3343 domain-containing protein [Oscillospiraceae bacterium]
MVSPNQKSVNYKSYIIIIAKRQKLFYWHPLRKSIYCSAEAKFRKFKKEDTRMEKRIIITGSQTSAVKAARLLEKEGIAARIVRAPKERAHGCRFGVEVSFYHLARAASLLEIAQIDYSDIVR